LPTLYELVHRWFGASRVLEEGEGA